MKIIRLSQPQNNLQQPLPQYRNGLEQDLPSRGDIVKFRRPLPDEDPNQEYILLDSPEGGVTRVSIQALNTGMSFPGIERVDVNDLRVCKKML